MSESRNSGESRSIFFRPSYSSESRNSGGSKSSYYNTYSYSSESRDSSESRSSYSRPNYSSESREETQKYGIEKTNVSQVEKTQAEKDVLMIDDLIESLNNDIDEFKKYGSKATQLISEKQRKINELKALREEAELALMVAKDAELQRDNGIDAKIEELKNRYCR